MNIGIDIDNTLTEIQEEITSKAKPRINAVQSIKKLKEEGHKIYIITARDNEFHDNPYQLSTEWLDRNNIKYDKLIVNARNKVPVCVQEQIDLFIDDQLNNCLEIAKSGIKTIRISDDKATYDNVSTLDNWNEIYKFISELK